MSIHCAVLSHSVVSDCLWPPMDCSPPGSSVHGILQARIVEWVAYPFSRASSQPKDWTQVFCIAGGFFTSWATREAHSLGFLKFILFNQRIIALQYYVGFSHTSTWISHRYTYVSSLLNPVLTNACISLIQTLWRYRMLLPRLKGYSLHYQLIPALIMC